MIIRTNYKISPIQMAQSWEAYSLNRNVNELNVNTYPFYRSILFKKFASNSLQEDDDESTQETESQSSSSAYKVVKVPIKSLEQCRHKVSTKYKDDANRLIDVVRGSIVCNTESDIISILNRFMERSSVQVIRVQNNFATPQFTGMRDVVMNVVVKGHVCEVQLYLKCFWGMEEVGRHLHQYFGEYFGDGGGDDFEKKMDMLHTINAAIENSSTTTEDASINVSIRSINTETNTAIEDYVKSCLSKEPSTVSPKIFSTESFYTKSFLCNWLCQSTPYDSHLK